MLCEWVYNGNYELFKLYLRHLSDAAAGTVSMGNAKLILYFDVYTESFEHSMHRIFCSEPTIYLISLYPLLYIEKIFLSIFFLPFAEHLIAH